MGTYSTAAPSQDNPRALTGKERWNRYVNETYTSPGIYVASLGSALEGQAFGYPKEWGGDFAGYGRRAASQYGLIVFQNAIHEGGAAALG